MTITRPADGATYAQGADIKASFSCADETGGTGIESCTGTVADGASIDTATRGTKTFTVTAVDEAGNSTERTVTYTVADQTRPTIALTRPTDDAAYVVGSDVKARYTCSDETGGTGIASCVGTVADGAAIDTTPGRKTFRVTATDEAGNTLTRTVTYRTTAGLAVTTDGTGSGTVQGDGIDCGNGRTACSLDRDAGSTATLTATAAPDSVFTGWTGACTGTGACTVTLDQARTVTATFTRAVVTPAGTPVSTPTGTTPTKPSCLSRRSFTVTFRVPGTTLRRGTITLFGKTRTLRRTPRGTLFTTVDLRGRPAGTYRIRLTATTAAGTRVTRTAAYRTCAPPRAT
ncbi:InlB B-repeat-containing protein [Paraconexibacter algicola]|uniref:Bacterial repeat domain-containing protein n=1 Tax=Paraconexibacter algicola TaxID=2133960 RepID=A0A2T4UKB8_9ACTN|nr:hypothetical protein [Paraconexibacter algicola]PTL59657.1 hypothetical protein C7Y72_08340 [Paraconexibacter algicola]